MGKTERFITKALVVHGNKYDYTVTIYNHSHQPIAIQCKEHGIFMQRPNDHLSGRGCPICAKLARRKTCLIRYGVDNPTKSKEIVKKQQDTNQARYGVNRPLQSSMVREKYTQTMIMRFGVESPLQHNDTHQKFISTMLQRYGVKYAQQHVDIKQTTKLSIIRKWGCEHPMQLNARNSISLLNDYDWLYTEYVQNNKTAIAIAESLQVDNSTVGNYLRKHNIPIQIATGYSKIAIQWLDYVAQLNNVIIEHAGNIQEYHIPNTRYRVDGFCRDTNTVYEFYGDRFHGNLSIFNREDQCHPFTDQSAGELYEKTMARERYIRDMGYTVVSIWELEYRQQSRS